MKNLLITFILLLFFIGCGGGGEKVTTLPTNISEPTIIIGVEQNSSDSGPLTILGHISYEYYVPTHTNGTTTLSSSNIATKPAKEIIVKAVNENGEIVERNTTDSNGDYILNNIPENYNIKIRAYAQLKSENWDVRVVNNQQNDAQYVSEGDLINTGTSDQNRTLKMVVSNLSSAPFAMLDDIYQAMQKVLVANSNAYFPPLLVQWSTKNITQITNYNGNGIIQVLGDQQGDSDEYDNHVIIHEWGHYFEDKFSRSDSIGGAHGSGEKLDIRVAFGEGWGNAWSAIATDDPYYYDTHATNNGDKSGWNMNIESVNQKDTPGYFSEASIQRILYDLYDNNDDGQDTLSLGFTPLYNIFVNQQKQTPAFTSIFSFITELKNANSSNSGKIDNITSSENISDIADIYGTQNDSNLYKSINIGDTISISTSTTNGTYNKLENHRYIRFTIATAGDYTIDITTTSSNNPDPDFKLYFRGGVVEEGISSGLNESKTVNLSTGDYLLDIYDANSQNSATFNVTIN